MNCKMMLVVSCLLGRGLLKGVSDAGVAVDFYACDSLSPAETFVLA